MDFNEGDLGRAMAISAAVMPLIDYAVAELQVASSERHVYDLTAIVELVRQTDELAAAALEVLAVALTRAGVTHGRGDANEHARAESTARQRGDEDEAYALTRERYAAYSGMTGLERCLYDIERLLPLPAVASDSGSPEGEERRIETAYAALHLKALFTFCQREQVR